jgi:hypothetical protein
VGKKSAKTRIQNLFVWGDVDSDEFLLAVTANSGSLRLINSMYYGKMFKATYDGGSHPPLDSES